MSIEKSSGSTAAFSSSGLCGFVVKRDGVGVGWSGLGWGRAEWWGGARGVGWGGAWVGVEWDGVGWGEVV